MNETATFHEKAADTLHKIKDKLNMEDAKRLVKNGREYAKKHPGTALAASVAAGFLIGYVARAVVDHRRRASA